jgi:hypothetical protein
MLFRSTDGAIVSEDPDLCHHGLCGLSRRRSADIVNVESALGRDLEITSYFPHQQLTARLIRRLFRDLAQRGLRVGARDREHYPVLEEMYSAGERGVSLSTQNVEGLLRARTGALPSGYGFIPLLGKVAGLTAPAVGTMQFTVHSPSHPELDGLHLRFDDAALRLEPTGEDDVGPGWRAVLTWYGIICESLRVAYGYGDWEDLFLQTVIPPSRQDVLDGRIDMLYRLNCFGPRLVERFGRSHLLATPAEAVVGLRYGGVLIGGKLSYAGSNEERFSEAGAHLQFRTRANQHGIHG